MNNPLTYGTVCSGIECMSAAALGLPLKPLFFAEIEPYPCAVLRDHFPHVPNFGDMTQIKYNSTTKELTNGRTTITLPTNGLDILAGGTPCQDFSLAGKRAGADGDNCDDGGTTRSSLCFNFIRLLREIRPRFFLYENVPGMLTSNEGRDFAHFLVALGESGYGDVAWRILDAQYVRVDGMERAVPQRRRRVWVVGCLGENHGAAQTILLERDRHQGNTPPRRKTREEIAASLVGWTGIYDAMVEQNQANRADRIFRIGRDRSNGMLSANPLSGFPEVNISPTLDTLIPTPTKAQGGAAIVSQIQRGSNGNNVAPTIAVNSNGGDVAPCLTSKDLAGQVTQENERRDGYVLTAPHSFNFELYATPPRNLIDAICARRAKDWMVTDSVPTQGVDSYNQSTTGNVAHTLRGEGCLDTTGGVLHTAPNTKFWDGYNTAHTLTTVSHNQYMPDCGHLEAVCIPSAFENHQSDKRISDANNLAPTMGASRNANASNNNPLLVSQESAAALPRVIVRRLTPLECERLQGLPDGWTTVDFRGHITDELVADFQRIHDFWARLNAEEGKTPKPKTADWVRQWLERISTNPPDAPRYKACGNGWAANEPRWILFNLLHFLDPNWMDTLPSAVVWNQYSKRTESMLPRIKRDIDDVQHERRVRN